MELDPIVQTQEHADAVMELTRACRSMFELLPPEHAKLFNTITLPIKKFTLDLTMGTPLDTDAMAQFVEFALGKLLGITLDSPAVGE